MLGNGRLRQRAQVWGGRLATDALFAVGSLNSSLYKARPKPASVELPMRLVVRASVSSLVDLRQRKVHIAHASAEAFVAHRQSAMMMPGEVYPFACRQEKTR